jgi:SAM-dependent methyltransferase
MARAVATAPGVEVLDDPASDPALVQRMLRDIARANRWLGGRTAVRRGLAHLLGPADRGRRFTLLDIGTGAGDLPREAARWAARRGVTLVPLGLERIRAAATLARSAGIPTVVACASRPPLRDGAVDIVLVSQVAHHFDGAQARRLFAHCSRLARRGVVIADLRPAPLAAAGFRVAGPLLGLHRRTVADGVISIARGFSLARLRAALPPECHAMLARCPIGRIVAAWRTDG